ncbi:GNAT family N-acetyltransferase [Actinoplanes sp. NPDC048796]|uniref:GNAT family N-acetyltransferase n=1 Tax=Actinoplanes sp. NPDC048796 TaxID=3155640 RepID=UPI00340BA9D1
MLATTPAIAAGSLGAKPQPTLTADGDLILRPWRPADAPAFLGAYQDPAIKRWHTNRPDSLPDVLAWFTRYEQDWRQETGGHWAVTGPDDRVLGRLAMRGWNFADGNAGCAYWVRPEARGAGVAPRALTALTLWAFGVGFHRLELGHSTLNMPSCRVAEKSGYVLEGTQRSSAIHEDGRHDMHVHARIR